MTTVNRHPLTSSRPPPHPPKLQSSTETHGILQPGEMQPSANSNSNSSSSSSSSSQADSQPGADSLSLSLPREALTFLDPYLPPAATPSTTTTTTSSKPTGLPHITLTFATSLDSAVALAPGMRTSLSGAASKGMTHHLRGRHDGVLVGAGTAVADDPGLNCRLAGAGGYGGPALAMQPRPVVVDLRARWAVREQSRVLRLVREGRARAPWVVVGVGCVDEGARALLEGCGGRVLEMAFVEVGGERRFRWRDVFERLWTEGLASVMVEGGANVINELLKPQHADLVDAVVITIAPTWLGRGGVVVSPERRVDGSGNVVNAARLERTVWRQMGDDVVLCGTLAS